MEAPEAHATDVAQVQIIKPAMTPFQRGKKAEAAPDCVGKY
jgi:hypothetical protein